MNINDNRWELREFNALYCRHPAQQVQPTPEQAELTRRLLADKQVQQRRQEQDRLLRKFILLITFNLAIVLPAIVYGAYRLASWITNLWIGGAV